MNKHHHINYIELQAEDLEAVKKFYSATFGWKFTDYGPDYAAFNDGTLDGGFERGKAKKGSAVLVIVYSENLEATLKNIKKNGGAITKQVYSFPGGRRFHFADPAHNELAVWSEK